MKIENIFDEQDGGELYYLLKRFGYIDAALSFELKRFIKIKSGSDYIDKRLADIIAILAFPFHLLKNKAYHTHEMRGWKLMLGLLIEQYFPQEKGVSRWSDVMNLFISLPTFPLHPPTGKSSGLC